MIIVAVLLLIGAVASLAVGLGVVATTNGDVQKRAREYAHREQPKQSKRLLKVNRLPRGWVASFTPPTFVDAIERNLVLAGRPAAWTVDKAVTYKPIGLAVGSLFFLVMLLKGGAPVLVLVGLIAIPLGYFTPDLLIYNMAIKRQEQIQKELPDLLDQIVISIEAGVGFEQALSRAGERNEGPLAEEVLRLVQDMTLGLSRREAYLALANRSSVDDLKNFCGAVVQAEEYGISIASVVRSQAVELRHARRMRAEAEAQKVPVKILVPLMLCVLPVLFIIVLGPAIVSAYAQ